MYRKTDPDTASGAASNYTDSGKNWRKHSNFFRKTNDNETASLTAVPGRYTDNTRTWRRINSLWMYNFWYDSLSWGWKRIHYKNANVPYATTAPTLRYNSYNGKIIDTYETDAVAWWASDPYQPQWAQMGPGPAGIGQDVWYLDSNGNQVGSSTPTFLWGKDGVWFNSSTATTDGTIVYNSEFATPELAAYSYDDEGNYNGDKLRNSQAVLEAYDRYYIWYKVSKSRTVGGNTLTGQAFSQAVYITRQEPVVTSFVMQSPETVAVGTAKTVTFNIRNEWWRKASQTQSYIEWHELDTPTQTPTYSTLKKSDLLYLTTITTENSTSLQGSYSYTPVGVGKYVLAKLVVKNSYTDKPPVTDIVRTQITSVATAATSGPFTISGVTKNYPSYDSTYGYQRSVSVNIGQSANATKYEVQIEGQYPFDGSGYGGGSYSTWTVLQSYASAPYVNESSRSGGILTYSKNVADYQFYRVTVRASVDGNSATYAYSNNGTSSTPSYVYAEGFGPSTPYISNITTSSNTIGTYINFDVSLSSEGSNRLSYWQYSMDGGYSWNTPSGYDYIAFNGARFYVSSGTYYSFMIRANNMDGFTSSSSNQLSITSFQKPGDPTNVVFHTYNNYEGTIYFTTGSNTQSVQYYLDYESGLQYESKDTYINIGSNDYGSMTISGMSSLSRSYTPYLLAYSGTNKTGGQGNSLSYSPRSLNGTNKPTATFSGTPTVSNQRTVTASWTGGGAANEYYVQLYDYYGGYVVASTTTTSTSASFGPSDGTDYAKTYYFFITPRYRYAGSIYTDGQPAASSNVTTYANLTAPTITDVQTSDGNNWTITVSGGGPYYQVYWLSSTPGPSNTLTNYDAASTSTTISETYSTTGSVYWWARSSTENRGNTTTSGNATIGTFSDWSSYYLAHQVTYNYNGGSGSTSRATVKDSTYTQLPTPNNRSGYTFNGWYTASSGGTYLGGSGSYVYITSTQTIYAQWTLNLSSPTISSVTFNSSNNTWTVNYSGGSGPYYHIWYQTTSSTTTVPSLSGTKNSVADQTSSSASSTDKVLSPSAGYAYYWWVRSSTTLNGTGDGVVSDWNGPVTMSPMNTSAPTLSGTTKVGQTLTFGVGSWVNATYYDLELYRGTAGVITSETQSKDAGNSTSSTYVIPSSDFTDPNNRKYYRSFAKGFNPSYTNTSFVAGTELGPLVNLTLYTISFDSKGGSAVSDLTQSTEGGSIAKPSDPTLSGQNFGGWSTTNGGTTAVSWPRTPSSNETLYAIWTSAASYSITYNGNGNTGGSTTATTGNGSVTVRANGFTRTNCTFSSWNTSADGSGTTYSPNDSYNLTANVTFYAIWTAVTNSATAPTGFKFDGNNLPTSGRKRWSWTGVGTVTGGTATGIRVQISSTSSTSGFSIATGSPLALTARSYDIAVSPVTSARWLRIAMEYTDGLGVTRVGTYTSAL